MLMPMNVFEWQVLRAVLRAKSPPTGRELRLVPSRRTKDGSFLSWFTVAGLLKITKPNDDPFEARYALTDLGKHAAEWGEFEASPALMGQLQATRNAKSPATA